MKIILTLVLVMLLSACGKVDNTTNDGYYTGKDFSEHCLNGVVYYVRSIGYKAFMSVKINKDTKEPELCK